MKTLYSYIQNTQNPRFDGHIHFFNHISPIVGKIPHESYYDMKMIGFMDIEFDNIDKYNVIKLYDNFIKNEYDPNKHILLATGTNIKEIKSLYNKYSNNIIRGFGELKCYDEYQNKPVNYKDILFVDDVVSFSSDCGSLPVYIHWELNNEDDVIKLESILNKYPNVPIILCHFGMNENNKDYAYKESYRLSSKYDNLWLDVSYTALDYFSEKPMNIFNFPNNRIIMGSDLNNKIYGENHNFEEEYNEICRKMNIIYKFVNTDKNISNLFNF